MISSNDLTALAGKNVAGPDGAKIGKIVDVYESTEGADATFVTVSTGLFGGHASFVPLTEATLAGDTVTVPYDKELVKDAPRVDADQDLTSAEEDRLYQHYNLTASPVPTSSGRHASETAIPRGSAGRDDLDGDGVFDDVKDTAVGRDTSGLTTDDAMTRSEERLRVGTETVEAGRARLRKRVITKTQSATVATSREKAVLTREPITAANMPQAMDGPAISEEEHEVILTAERPVVTTEAVPVERVRMEKATVTETESVSGEVRKEHIEADGADGADGDRTDRV